MQQSALWPLAGFHTAEEFEIATFRARDTIHKHRDLGMEDVARRTPSGQDFCLER